MSQVEQVYTGQVYTQVRGVTREREVRGRWGWGRGKKVTGSDLLLLNVNRRHKHGTPDGEGEGGMPQHYGVTKATKPCVTPCP